MAKEIVTDAKVVIASTDLGNKARSVTIEGNTEVLETTGFGDSARTYLTGFKDWQITVEYYDDFADNDLNELMFSWWGTSQTIEVTKADTTVSATNPKYSGTVLITNPTFLRAGVGQVAGGTLTLRGTGTLTRAVA